MARDVRYYDGEVRVYEATAECDGIRGPCCMCSALPIYIDTDGKRRSWRYTVAISIRIEGYTFPVLGWVCDKCGVQLLGDIELPPRTDLRRVPFEKTTGIPESTIRRIIEEHEEKMKISNQKYAAWRAKNPRPEPSDSGSDH